MEDNIESMKNLRENLEEYGQQLERVPVVIQYNKRDLPGAVPLPDLEAKLNPEGWPSVEAVAVKGEGVMQTLKTLSKIVIERLNEEYSSRPGVSVAPPAPEKSEPERAAHPAAAAAARAGDHERPAVPSVPSAARPVPAFRPAAARAEPAPPVGTRISPVFPKAAKPEPARPPIPRPTTTVLSPRGRGPLLRKARRSMAGLWIPVAALLLLCVALATAYYFLIYSQQGR